MHAVTDLQHGLDQRSRTTAAVSTALPQLTPTQMEVLKCVRSGLLNKQIAHELGIAEATVKVHMTAVMRKLNVRNRTQAAIVAGDLGWA
jgi:DNA-binding NarL/FixJ family response regulator